MPGKQAKILSLGDVNDLLVFATCTRHPLRNRAIVLLATKAGLRAGEIANLTWVMVVGPTGDIAPVIELRDIAAKNGSGRLIPARRSDDAARHRRLVQSRLQEYWAEGMFVAFRPPNFRHPRRSRGSRGRWLATRCPVARRSRVNSDDRAIH
jgi:integrase